MITLIDSHVTPSPTPTQRTLQTLLSGLYVYGFGVNHSCNAISNHMGREGVTHDLLEGWIYFYDEYVGHWIIVLAYAALQIMWIVNGWGVKEGRKGGGGGGVIKGNNFERPGSNYECYWLVYIGAVGGYLSSMLIIESQAVPIIIPLDILLLTLLLVTPKKSKLDRYILLNTLGHGVVFAVWWGRFGRWIEPSELRGEGWSDAKVLSLGFIPGV